MPDETKTKKKPRVLKRQGKNIEESVLFHDDMDEELLAKIEESLSGRSRKVLSQDVSPTQKRLVLEADQDDPKGREVVITVEEKKRGEKTLDLSKEDPDDQSPDPEGISEVTVSLDEDASEEGPEKPEEEEERARAVVDYQEGRQRRDVLYWMFLVTCFFCGVSGGLWGGRFFPALHTRDTADVRIDSGFGGAVHMVQDMFLPLDGGESTLYLGMAMRIHGPHSMQQTSVTDASLREIVYQASTGLKPADLKGYHGMRRLKARVEDLMRKRYPAFEVREVTFLNYVVL